jgi:hypothetical protein
MTAQLPTQQQLDQAKLMSTAPIGFQMDPQAYFLHHNWQPDTRTPEENRAYYHEYQNRLKFYRRYLPDMGPSDGLALTLWHLCTGDHKFIVLVSESPDVDRTIIDTFLARVEADFGHVIEGRRVKVVGFNTNVGLTGTKHLGRRPDLIILNGHPALYEQERTERWIEKVVLPSVDKDGSVVTLNAPLPKPIEIELEVPSDPEGDIRMVVDGELFINGEKVGKVEEMTIREMPVHQRVTTEFEVSNA